MPHNFTIVLTQLPLPTTPIGPTKVFRTTAYDMVQSLRDYAGAQASGEVDREARRALLDGYREFWSSANWTYLLKWNRIQVRGKFTLGTVTYTQSNQQCTLVGPTGPVTAATNASPIVVTSASHGLATNNRIIITGATGNTAANGTWVITVIDANTFSLNGSTGNGVYNASSGTWVVAWPTWAGQASIRIGSGLGTNPSSPSSGVVAFQSIGLISANVIQLDPILNPGVDITTASSFTLYADQYELPDDFQASNQWFADVAWGGMSFVNPNQWMQVTRYYFSFSNTPRYYSFIGSRWTPGRMCLVIFPFPDQDRTLDSIYRRKPRAITIWDYNTGSLSGTLGQNTVSGNGTTWTAAMVGSVLRISGDNVNLPTNFEGDTPFAEEHIITQVNSATQLTLDTALAASYTGVKHRVSDLVDIEEGAMTNAMRCCCEKRFARQRSMKTYMQAVATYKEALVLAREADERSFETRSAGMGGAYRTRMAFQPRGVDVP